MLEDPRDELQEAKQCINYRDCKYDWLCSGCTPPFMCKPETCENFKEKLSCKPNQCANYAKCNSLWTLDEHFTPFTCNPSNCNSFEPVNNIKNIKE